MNVKTIQSIIKIVGNRSSMPILDNLYINRVSSFFTNLELTVKFSSLASFKGIASPSELPFVFRDQKDHRIEEIDQFPNVDFDSNSCFKNDQLISKEVIDHLNQAINFASDDESRINICSILFENEKNNLNIISTNGHTLYNANLKGSWQLSTFILPIDSVKKFLKIAKLLKENDLKFSLKDRVETPQKIENAMLRIEFSKSGIVLYMRLLEATFPDYKQVLPVSYHTSFDLQDYDNKQLKEFFVNALKHDRSVNHYDRKEKQLAPLIVDLKEAGSFSFQYKDLASFIFNGIKKGKDQLLSLSAYYLDLVFKLKPRSIKIESASGPVCFDLDDNTNILVMPMRLDR